MNDEKHNFYDVIIKFISGIFIVIAFFIGLKQFKINTELEFKKIYYTNQLVYLNDLIESTSELCKMNLTDKEINMHADNFRSLYYGKVEFFISDHELKSEIKKFSEILDHLTSKNPIYKNETTNGALKNSARKIAELSKKYIDELYETKIYNSNSCIIF